MMVEVLVEGKTVEASYLAGDNSQVLPTDTIKNTVYVLAKKHEFKSIEEFACLVATYFLQRHPSQMLKTTVSIVEENWTRIENASTKGQIEPHHHAFVRSGSEQRSTKVVATNGGREMTIESSLAQLKVLKTTQSSFERFYRDEYTTLPDVSDRLVGSIVSASWTYSKDNLIG